MHIGHRLSYNGALCTVRFIGEVKNTKGEWIGVEWDDPTRGKHDGTHESVRYFTCVSKHPTAASFIRPTRPADPRYTFLRALRRKYVDGETTRSGLDGDGNVSKYTQGRQLHISGKLVEEIGFDKAQAQLADLQHLRLVVLDGMRVARADEGARHMSVEEAGCIRRTCPEIVDLDLGRNLFEEWEDVLDIAAQLGKLKNLGAGGNRFHNISVPRDERPKYETAFRNIESLNLDSTLLLWTDICHMAAAFPSLTTLSAARNRFNHLEDVQLLDTITMIDLHDNEFEHLSDIRPISKLQNLKTLNLKMNSIKSTIPSSQMNPGQSAASLTFTSALTTLDLSYNAINSWSIIDLLSKTFPGLNSLRISHNPLYQSLSHPDGRYLSPADGYSLTIARIAPLAELNYSPITPRDRLDAEVYYLSLIAAELSRAETPNDKKTIIARHPRYSELTSQYGDPTISSVNPDTSTSTSSNTLAANLLTIIFRVSLNSDLQKAINPDASSNEKRLHSSKDRSSSSNNKDRSKNKTKTKNYVDRSAENVIIADTTTTTFTKEIPRSFNVYAVLGIVGRHLDVFPLNLKLVWETGEWVYAGGARITSSVGVSNHGDDGDYDGDDGDDDRAWDSEEEELEQEQAQELEKEIEVKFRAEQGRDGEIGGSHNGNKIVLREVEIVAGTRSIGTWVDGNAAVVRVEYEERY